MDGRGATFSAQGYLLIDRLVSDEWCTRAIVLCDPLLAAGTRARPGVRRVAQREPRLRAAIEDSPLPDLVQAVAGPGAILVRSILFDKSPSSNWSVGWHQDAVIAVHERAEAEGFGPWSIKDGETHCRPPREVLDSIVVVRVHLDRVGPANGPLRLVPGSDRLGVLSEAQVESVASRGPWVECVTDPGGAVVMRPHTVHASPRSTSDARRRVLHLEYSPLRLPAGLRWAEADVPSGARLHG